MLYANVHRVREMACCTSSRFIMITGFVFAGLVKESYVVKGMHCQFGCANKVQSMMANLEGVEKCEVDFESSKIGE